MKQNFSLVIAVYSTTNLDGKMKINFCSQDQRNAFIKCCKFNEDEYGVEHFAFLEDDGMTYGMSYHSKGQFILLMLEHEFEGYWLAIECSLWGSPSFRLTNIETGEEEDYDSYEKLMEEKEEEKEEEVEEVNADDAEEVIIDGVMYLAIPCGALYDFNTQELVGMWNKETNTCDKIN